MIAAIDWTPIITVLAGGGILGGIAAFVKLWPQRKQIHVATMGEIIEALRAENARLELSVQQARTEVQQLRAEVHELNGLWARLEQMEAHIRRLEAENAGLRAENTSVRAEARRLQGRVGELEAEVRRLGGHM